MKAFVAEVQKAVQRSSWSIEHLAAKLDKAPSTLYAELNPWGDTTHKLGLQDAICILDCIRDYTPLQIISHHCGYSVKEQGREPDGRNMDHECLQGYQAVSRFIEAAQDREDPEVLAPLCNNAVDELEDVVKRRRREKQEEGR